MPTATDLWARLLRQPRKGETVKQVDFYFDFVSPYAWVASHQLTELRKCTPVKVRFVPVLFAGLLDHHANFGPAEIPAKRRYTFQDAQRWAVYLGLEFRSPPAHPFNPLKPLRVTSTVDDDDLRETLAMKLLDAAWSGGRDVTSDSVIDEVATSIGLDGKDVLARSQSDEIKRKLRLQTESAIQAGVFGIPSFVVDGELFWGSDRLHFLEAHLKGRLPEDKAKLEEILARPRAADRRRCASRTPVEIRSLANTKE
jgi:2-hydroxychromene-2-carboxylate isomerase